MKHLINIIKEVELDIRTSNNLSREVLVKLSELTDWDYKIVQDAILRIRMAISNNNLNFVYKYYENEIEQYEFYKNKQLKKVDLLICSLRRDISDTAMTDAQNRLYVPNGITYDTFEIWGHSVTQARNFAVKEAVKRDCKYILFIDDDIIAPNNALMKLFDIINDESPVVSANYYKKIYPLETAHKYTNSIISDIQEVDLCAMGFTLIDIQYVSKHVPFPLFWEFGAPDGFWTMGEDAFFTNNFKKYCPDKKILVDNTIKILHYDKVWKQLYGERDKQVTYATNWINDLEHFERLRVPNKYPKIAIAIPTRTKEEPIACNLQKLHCLRGYQTEFITVSNLPVDEARNYLVYKAFEVNADYLLFIDNDIIPPIDGLCKLIEHIEKEDVDVVSGNYLLKGEPKHSVHLQLDKDGMVNEIERIEDLPLIFKSNWLIGLGFALIDMSIFRQARQPWFKCHSKTPTEDGVNEDAHFTELCFENGFNVWVDRTIECLHVDFKNQKVYSNNPNFNIKDYAGFNKN